MSTASHRTPDATQNPGASLRNEAAPAPDNAASLAGLDIEQLAQLLRAAGDSGTNAERSSTSPDLPDVRVDRPCLSLAQERLWFMDQLAPGNPFYNIPFAFRLTGALKVNALQRAWLDTLERHDALRIRIHSESSQEQSRAVSYRDASQFVLTYRPDASEALLDQAMRHEADTGFHLERDPLIRGTLFGCRDGSHVLIFTAHHIVFDGWSIGLFLHDLMDAYAAREQGKYPEWQPLPVSYGQYAVWHRDRVDQLAERESLWWREQLANLPDLELPADLPRPAAQSFQGDVYAFTVPRDITEKVESLAGEENATPYAVWLALFSLALSRFSARNDFAVGSSFAGRIHPATEGLVGFFVENLSIRIRLDQNATLRDLIRNVRDTALETLEHAELPFQMLADALGRQRDLSRNPVYQAAFTYQNMLSGDLRFGGIGFEALSMPAHTTHMDLEILAWPGENGLSCQLLYATDLFRPETMHRFADMFLDLARHAAADSQAANVPVARFGLNAAPSLTHGPVRSHPVADPWGMFAALCEENPQAPAVVAAVEPGSDGRERFFSRRELFEMAETLAGHLASRGVKRDSVVLLCREQGPELLASMLAVWRVGAVWTTLPVRHPSSLARWTLDDSGACCVLTERETWTIDPDKAVYVSEAIQRRVEHSLPSHTLQEEDLACILYTSGSSGRPKGVRLSHRALSNRLHWMWEQFPWNEGEVCCQKTSPVFVDFLWEAFGPLLGGIPLITLPGGAAANVPWLVALLERHKVSRLVLVPSLLAEMHRLDGGLTGRLPALRLLTSSGEALPPDLAAATLKALPSVRLLNLYGSTEVMGDASFQEVLRDEPGAVPIGIPIHNTVLAVLDEQGGILPRGAVGTLYVAGSCLAAGYHGAAESFDAAWLRPERHDGIADETFAELVRLGGRDMWFRTGDLARFDASGVMHHCGRGDRQVKIRGVRIEPEEIQAVLEAHPLVREARVLAVSAPLDNAAPTRPDACLAAYVIPDQDNKNPASGVADSESRCLTQWTSLYDSMYASVRQEGNILDNFLIWESSYTGQRIPVEQMREWLAESLASIHTLNPRSVLEVGCGQGFLLMDIARTCERYAGLDISEQALACLADILHNEAAPQLKADVLLAKSGATELPPLKELGGKAFDTAIFNSVVQYFPDHGYCLEAVRQAVDRLEPGGRVYLGDIRNYDGLELFHTAVQIHRCGPETTARSFLDMANARKRLESELLLAPAFWHALRSAIPRISGVRVSPKYGLSDNELTEFRYEVVLYCDEHSFAPFSGTILPWGEEAVTSTDTLKTAVQRFAQSGKAASGKTLGISGMPHARLTRYRMVRQLAEENCLAGTLRGLGELLREAEARIQASPAQQGLNPEDIRSLALTCGLEADISLDVRDGLSFNILFHAPGAAPCRDVPWPGIREYAGNDLAAYANAPASSRDETALRAALREYLGEHLAPSMIPDVVLTLPEWPRTPSGKIDWKRLPSPNMRLFAGTSGMQLPSTLEESSIADIWKLVIGIDEVSVHDNFFEIGGTSLLLTQVHQMIQTGMQRSFPLSVLFQYPTIHALAAWLSESTTKQSDTPEMGDVRKERLARQRFARGRARS